MKDSSVIRFSTGVLLSFIAFFSGQATAYNNQVFTNLSRSRDALLAQRAHLQDAAFDVKQQMDKLQTQLDTVNSYLTDTDNALRDVETAMQHAQ